MTNAFINFKFLTMALPSSGKSGWLDIFSAGYPVELMALVILCLFQLVVILILSKTILQLVGHQKAPLAIKEKKPSRLSAYFSKLDFSRDAELDMKHDYDGISELDNKTPAWWMAAFYGTILFGIIYLYRLYVSESMPGQLLELQQANADAAVQKINYLSAQPVSVDENSITMMGQDDVAKGSMIFSANCVACHGALGEGNVVGPNLTDKYWIHKGGIKDIYTTIKYGFPEKGMKSWKDDFSPLQIAQLASYVKTLEGTNPANGKEKQGELYIDSLTAGVAVDTIK